MRHRQGQDPLPVSALGHGLWISLGISSYLVTVSAPVEAWTKDLERVTLWAFFALTMSRRKPERG